MTEEYEVVSSKKIQQNADPDPSGAASNAGAFAVVALNFVMPSYIRANSKIDINFGSKVSVDGDVLSYNGEAVGTVRARKSVNDIKVDTSYDIKYTGGYSKDGSVIYLDAHFPKKLLIGDKEVDTVESIAKHHELPEKWMCDEGYSYQYAHVIATGIERKYVESLGVDWEAYSKEVEKYLHDTYARKLEKSPADLDISPYTASNDTVALDEIKASTVDNKS